MPLAVVGSNVVIEVNGKKVRGRQYPWGVAEGRFSMFRAGFSGSDETRYWHDVVEGCTEECSLLMSHTVPCLRMEYRSVEIQCREAAWSSRTPPPDSVSDRDSGKGGQGSNRVSWSP